MFVHEEIIDGKKLTDIMNENHENIKYLPGHKLPVNVVSCRNKMYNDMYMSLISSFGFVTFNKQYLKFFYSKRKLFLTHNFRIQKNCNFVIGGCSESCRCCQGCWYLNFCRSSSVYQKAVWRVERNNKTKCSWPFTNKGTILGNDFESVHEWYHIIVLLDKNSRDSIKRKVEELN